MTDKALPGRKRNPGKPGGNLGKSGVNPGPPIQPRPAHESQPPKRIRERPPGRRKYCGAKARSTGKPCQRWALIGKERCRLHGGKSLSGPANPAWKNGFYSKVLPADVAELARQAKADPELQNLKGLISVLDVDIQRGMTALQAGAVGAVDAQKAFRDMVAARMAGDEEHQVKAEVALCQALDGAAGQERAWAKLWELAERKDKLLTGEVNRHKLTADTINADRVAAMMVSMIDALREESEDRELLRRVFARWERIMGLAGMAPAGTGA